MPSVDRMSEAKPKYYSAQINTSSGREWPVTRYTHICE
jgi:hypothetical protein